MSTWVHRLHFRFGYQGNLKMRAIVLLAFLALAVFAQDTETLKKYEVIPDVLVSGQEPLHLACSLRNRTTSNRSLS